MAKKKVKNNKRKQVTKDDVIANITNISNEVLAAAYSAASPSVPPVLQKVCRLCESKDGPFLNIFDADKVTAKKIDELMPFSVLENDDLPHKICFRCSAKLEELYEFIQRCIKTQESLRKAVGKAAQPTIKSKMAKKVWEEKLNKNNMSNDDICDALIKKAMAGIQGIPLKDTDNLPVEETKVLPTADCAPIETKRITRGKESQTLDLTLKTEPDDIDEITLKQVKMSLENGVKSLTNKSKRSTRIDTKTRTNETTQLNKTDAANSPNLEISQFTMDTVNENKSILRKTNNSMSSLSFNNEGSAVNERQEETKPFKETKPLKETKEKTKPFEETKEKAKPSEEANEKAKPFEETKEKTKPFDIMDYVSMIKVNGVGVLFQCKLCNRNFLKKEVVESHNCAKNGKHCVSKIPTPISIPAPEPPKVPTVKYIKIDTDMKKTLAKKVKDAEKNDLPQNNTMETTVQNESNESSKSTPKTKVGPASKTRRNQNSPQLDLTAANQSTEIPLNTDSPNSSILPSIHFATMPNLNSRFKLCPGPNNIFTLIEDSSTALPTPASSSKNDEPKKQSRKRKFNKESATNISSDQNSPELESSKTIQKKIDSPEVIDLEDPVKPYPVGLFQTMNHSSRLYEPTVPKTPPTFTTPAMKKQSYTVVQTGNPSKLLISTKAVPVSEDLPKKRQRKSKLEVRDEGKSKEPFTVTLEDRTLAPQKDSNFFTFINVDPLLQPSYVLPTDSIIQESQISTSSSVASQPTESKDNKDKEKYHCNMCNESFSREKKLLSHIQSHYTKMDEEDQKRVEKVSKKRVKK